MPTVFESELYQHFLKRKVWKVIPLGVHKQTSTLWCAIRPQHAFALTHDSEDNYILTAARPVNIEEVYVWLAPLVPGQDYIAVNGRTHVPTGIDTTTMPYADYMKVYKGMHKATPDPSTWGSVDYED